MKLRKLATNSTNSAGISETGNIYVWGSTKFGLIINDDTKSSKEYETTPQLLKLGK
jgi:alpha-tubulin suppressor-like RCC1 family protein